MVRRVGLLAALLATACCSKSDVKSGGTGSAPAPPPPPTFTIMALAEVRGQIGPCGCTTDPLGDIARTTQLVADARRAGPTLMLDAGSLLYSKIPIPELQKTQDDLKADLLGTIYKTQLRADAVGVGPADLAYGPTGDLKIPRTTVSLDGKNLDMTKLLDAGGVKVGVFGVIAEGAIASPVENPLYRGGVAVALLKQQGARFIVALVQAPDKRAAVQLARGIDGIDLAIAGLGASAPEPDAIETQPQQIGKTWLVIPANRGQIVARLDVWLRDGAGPLADAVGPSAAGAKAEGIDKQLAALDADLKRFAADKSADPAFVAQKQRERDELAAARARLAAQPFAIPAAGSYFTLSQVRINKKLACAPAVQDAVTAFFHAAGESNVKAAAALPAPVAPKGQPTYVGDASCDDCHSDAVAFWKKTVHAKAWDTLVERGQEFDLDCIGCHVTGYEKPGGSNLGHNDKLRSVQCETCHGPSSIHVAKGGEEKPPKVLRAPPRELCARECHTKEHSDTFQYEAYLRDIVGPGHGDDLRKKLGDGPTGATLRKAALDKAGRELGAKCVR
jgi:cytochrome c5